MCLVKEHDERHGVLHAGMVIGNSNHPAGFVNDALRRIPGVFVRGAEGHGCPIFGDAPAGGGEVIAEVHIEDVHCSTMASEQWLVSISFTEHSLWNVWGFIPCRGLRLC